MPIAPGSIAPADDLVTPLVQQLALVAQQIQGIQAVNCFIQPPDNAVPDQSVLFPLREWHVLDDTNGKVKVRYTFEILHLFRRGNLTLTLPQVYTYVHAWFNVLTAYSNQTLGGLAIQMDLIDKPGTVKGFRYGGIEYIALSNMVSVLTEFNINLT